MLCLTIHAITHISAYLSIGPVVNKLVFSIIIASIGVVILAILFLLCKSRKTERDNGRTIKTEPKSQGKITKCNFEINSG